MAVISSRNQVTIPADILREACPTSGDQVLITVTGSDRLVRSAPYHGMGNAESITVTY